MTADDSTASSATFPQTVYAVAFTLRADDGRECTAVTLFVVSGDNPLTEDEAAARGAERIPPGHTVVGKAVSRMVQKRAES
jgi:hypothetical protein